MPPLNSTQKAALYQFMSITGLPEKTATKIIKGTGWKLDQALNSWSAPRITDGRTINTPSRPQQQVGKPRIRPGADDKFDNKRDNKGAKDGASMARNLQRQVNFRIILVLGNYNSCAFVNIGNDLVTAFITIFESLAQEEPLTAWSFYESNGGISVQSKERDSLEKLFEKYRASTDEEGVVTIDGMMNYFGDLGVDIETAEVLVPVEIIQAPAMGVMTKESFINGWKANRADSIPKQKAYLASQIQQLSSDMALFKRVYRHTFIFAKEKDQKALPKDTAVVYWDLLFKSPGKPWITTSTNWIEMWIEFLGAKWNKSVNKDMWNQTFEFFLKTMEDETLGFWSEDGAWPGVIDDFVAYAKEKRGDVPESMETD